MKKAIVITLLSMGLMIYLTCASNHSHHPYDGYQQFYHNTQAEMYENALKLLDRGQLNDALIIVKKLYDDAIAPFTIALHLGNIYIRTGRYEEALGVYNRLEQQHAVLLSQLKTPSRKNIMYSHFYFNLGLLYKKLNRYNDSAAAFKKVLISHNYRVPKTSFEGSRLYSQIPPTQFYAKVHFQLGTVYLEMGDKANALKQSSRLQELDKNKSETLQHLIAGKNN